VKIFDLSGTVALVTGGNSGIGLGMARGVAMCGAAVAICGTNESKNAAAQAELTEIGVRAKAYVCDVGEQGNVTDLVRDVLDDFGRIDSCFANAGVSSRAPSFAAMSDDEWHRVLRVNLDGAFYTAQAFVNHVVEREGTGSLVFTTSGSAYFGQQRGQNYAASKAGLIAMSKGIAVEHARHGVRSNCVLAGWTESELTAPAFGWDKFVANVMPRVPLRRWGTMHDFSGIAAYLASPASAYHTGDVITIDGGYYSF
jgi:NAD(P)-dependent dehydrogenase (short-subunit alcohol dehydrogenase family)